MPPKFYRYQNNYSPMSHKSIDRESRTCKFIVIFTVTKSKQNFQ